jgi:low affinity Fe/Cu permease
LRLRWRSWPAEPRSSARRRRMNGSKQGQRHNRQSSKVEGVIERAARKVTQWTGSTPAFALSFGIVLVWLLTGPVFHYSDTWQLVINTGTTIITFLMVFLIQRAQNKDSLAIHLKLNEIVAALQGASNRLIDVEALSEAELNILREHYAELAAMSKRDIDIFQSHSVEEARHRHDQKVRERVSDTPPPASA